MYHILTKEEKRSLKEKYRNSKRGAVMLPRLNRLIVEGIFLIIFPIALILVGLVFLIGQYIIRTNEYNNVLKLQNELKKKLTKRR